MCGHSPNNPFIVMCSVDGLHKVDVANYVKLYPNSAMAELVGKGVSYPNSQLIPPSDSFPGLLAFFTGGLIPSRCLSVTGSWHT